MTSTDRFRLTLPRQVIAGRGSTAELSLVLNGGRPRIAIVGGSGEASDEVQDILVSAGHRVRRYSRHGEPTLDGLSELVSMVAADEPEMIIGVGGGSAIDSAKAVAGLIPNRDQPISDYFESVDRPASPLQAQPLPCVALPTTGGTGAEVTSNAVVRVGPAKVSLRDARLVPDVAIVDSALGDGVPGPARVAAAFDAVVQLIEAYATPMGNPVSRAAAYGGARLGFASLPAIVAGVGSAEERQDMAVAAMLSGVALASSKLGTIHGFAGVLGGQADHSHGSLCAAFAASVLAHTIDNLRGTGADSSALSRYRDLAHLCSGEKAAEPEALADWMAAHVAAAGISRPEIPPHSHPELIRLVAGASSTKGNPVALGDDTLQHILKDVCTPTRVEEPSG